jgi:hypothetical protein
LQAKAFRRAVQPDRVDRPTSDGMAGFSAAPFPIRGPYNNLIIFDRIR